MNVLYPIDPESKITSPFGNRTSPIPGASTNHRGIDFSTPLNTIVKAATGGTVKSVGFDNQRGNYVSIDNGSGLITNYYHLNKSSVKEGERVVTGQSIALSGNTGISTGPHLHFETILNGTPVDPLSLLSKEAAPGSDTTLLSTSSGIIETVASTTKAAIENITKPFTGSGESENMDGNTLFFIGAMVVIVLLFFKS